MRFAVIAASLLAAIVATPVRADDFTLTVPVRIQNMRYVDSASVNCDVLQDSPHITVGSTNNVPVHLTDHSFNGNLTIVVNVRSGFTRADATSYGCSLTYFWRMPDGTLFNRSTIEGERAGLYEHYTGQAVASTVESVTGRIAH